MMSDNTITIVGNLTADPDLRFTKTGAAVTNFTVASTPRTYDKQAGEWRDCEPMYLNVSCWRKLAENVATLTKGTRVIVTGQLKSRSYDDRDGNRRTVFEITADEVGVSLKFAPPNRNPHDAVGMADPWASEEPTF